MTRPYRVAYVVSHPIQYQAPLLRYLSESPEIDLTTFFLSDMSARRFHDPEFARKVEWDVPLLDGYRSEVLPAWGASEPLAFWRPLSRGLGAVATSDRFDALWIHGYAHQALLRVALLARRCGLPVLLRGESHLASHPRSPLRAALKKLLLHGLFRRVNAFLTIGSLNRAYYRHYGVGPTRLFDMPYAVDNAFFQARATAARDGRKALRRSLGLSPNRPVVLYAAKLVPRKRAEDLLEAFRVLAQQDGREPEVYLLFAGDGPTRASLEARVRELGWKSVRFLGFRNQSEMPALYDLCDVFVLPSEHEPWGLVVNEVMNAARPVIVSEQVGAAADLVEEGETGHVVPVRRPDELARALRRLLSDDDLRARMGRASLRLISSWNFERDRTGLLGALKQTVGRGKP